MIYLDNASTSYPKPELMAQRILTYVKDFGVGADSESSLFSKASDLCTETRMMLASLIGIENKDNIVFTMNATHALNLAIKGYVRKGDHILACTYSHNSVLRPLEALKRAGIITYDLFVIDEDGSIDLEALQLLVKNNTSMMIINHASNVMGVVSELEEVPLFCKKNKLVLLLDITQSILYKSINLNQLNADFVACTGHKNLLGPTGVGFLYVKNPELLNSLVEGGSRGNSSASPIHPIQMPYKFEAGTHNMLSISGLHGSLSYILNRGIDLITQHSMALIAMLYKELSNIGDITFYGTHDLNKKVPILSFNIKNILPHVAAAYYEKSHIICIRAGIQCAPVIHQYLGTFPTGTIRVSPGVFNTVDDISAFVNATKELVYLHNNQLGL